MQTVTVTLPLELTAEILRAVRKHPTTSTDDKDEEHRRIGWLICAWDVIVSCAPRNGDGVVVPVDALHWLFGEIGEFEPEDAKEPKPVGYKTPPYWWRGEFRKRAGL